ACTENIKQPMQCTIVDINGRLVYSSNKTTQPPYFTQDVDCNFLAKGMYVVQLITEKEVLSKKFIKH
ncbi:MAG: Secretion system C-terminal sorting domain, partial [Bacteroidota bacterium]